MNIPIIIICYNNYKYVDNTLKQIYKINKEYFKNICILDNCSTDLNTINYLKNVKNKVIYNKTNEGPWIEPDKNMHIYNILPDKFIVTDPDLEFNTKLPTNFIDILLNLSELHKCQKIGFALDISDFDKMYDNIYDSRNNKSVNIYEWEQIFWKNKIQNNYYELYHSQIDTTFSLINKKYYHSYYCIRVAGIFTAKHIPWYKNNSVLNVYNNYLLYINISNISCFSKIIIDYIETEYLKIHKNNDFFFIKKDDKYLNFWKNDYSKWKGKTFDVFDSFLNKDKIFINIGDFIGTNCIYGIRKSKHVYYIESDTNLIEYINSNCQNNCQNNYDKNYTLINKNLDLINIITIQSIIENYNINPNEISLINIDIAGKEENILNDLYKLHKLHNIPLYICFYYDNWNDKNLDRFVFLSEHNKLTICTNNCIDILFT